MVSVDLYSAIVTKVFNVLNTLVPREKPGFQALSKGLKVLLYSEIVRQIWPDSKGSAQFYLPPTRTISTFTP